MTDPRAKRNGNDASRKGVEKKEELSDTTGDDIIFETYYHRSGKEFRCMYLNNMRFYLNDWGSKEWQPFPKRWYNEGLLRTDSVVKNMEQKENPTGAEQRQATREIATVRQARQQQSSSGQDDREGFLHHPKKGKIPTYIFERKHNIHCFYDHDMGQWMQMPIGWELHHDLVGKLVDQVEEAFPHWGDRHDILALLRACNYDPDVCISTYLHLEGDPWLQTSKTVKEATTVAQLLKDDPSKEMAKTPWEDSSDMDPDSEDSCYVAQVAIPKSGAFAQAAIPKTGMIKTARN